MKKPDVQAGGGDPLPGDDGDCQVSTKRTGSLPCRIWFLRKSSHSIGWDQENLVVYRDGGGRVGKVTAEGWTKCPYELQGIGICSTVAEG